MRGAGECGNGPMRIPGSQVQEAAIVPADSRLHWYVPVPDDDTHRLLRGKRGRGQGTVCGPWLERWILGGSDLTVQARRGLHHDVHTRTYRASRSRGGAG